jgi:hypothetical protein
MKIWISALLIVAVAGLPRIDYFFDLEASANFPMLAVEDLLEVVPIPTSDKVIFAYQNGFIITKLSTMEIEHILDIRFLGYNEGENYVRIMMETGEIVINFFNDYPMKYIPQTASLTIHRNPEYVYNEQFPIDNLELNYAETTRSGGVMRVYYNNNNDNWNRNIPSSPTTTALFSVKFLDIANEPCVFRGYNTNLMIFKCEVGLPDYATVNMNFEIKRILENPGTATIIVEGKNSENQQLIICLMAPPFTDTTNCFRPTDLYRDSPFYTGNHIYYIKRQDALGTTYGRVSRADIWTDCQEFFIKTTSTLFANTLYNVEDPDSAVLYNSEKVVLFSANVDQPKELSIKKYKAMVPFMDQYNKIFLIHDDHFLGVRYSGSPEIKTEGTFIDKIFQVFTLPKTLQYVIFFESYFFIGELGTPVLQAIRMDHEVTEIITAKLEFAIFYKVWI